MKVIVWGNSSLKGHVSKEIQIRGFWEGGQVSGIPSSDGNENNSKYSPLPPPEKPGRDCYSYI